MACKPGKHLGYMLFEVDDKCVVCASKENLIFSIGAMDAELRINGVRLEDLRRAMKRNLALLKALIEYGQHAPSCALHSDIEAPCCDCGLVEVITKVD